MERKQKISSDRLEIELSNETDSILTVKDVNDKEIKVFLNKYQIDFIAKQLWAWINAT